MYTTYFAIQRESSFYLGETPPPPPKKNPKKNENKQKNLPKKKNKNLTV